jgi:phosphoenolpyruvate carboxylase
VIRKSILLRNPYTDVLNLLQIELLERARRRGASREDGEVAAGAEGADDEGAALTNALLASVNGIAAAMQSTG